MNWYAIRESRITCEGASMNSDRDACQSELEANILSAENEVSDLEADVCRAGFLCETARGDFRFGNAIENRARQSRAPLRVLARTRALAERPST